MHSADNNNCKHHNVHTSTFLETKTESFLNYQLLSAQSLTQVE